MKLKKSLTASQTAARLLPGLLADYLQTGRKLADGRPNAKQLHKFRIATKKFRYTVELFLPIYGARLDQELQPVREMQRSLGKLHDYHVIGQMLDRHKDLQAKLQRSTDGKLKEFRKQWAAFDTKSQRKRWKNLLIDGASKSP